MTTTTTTGLLTWTAGFLAFPIAGVLGGAVAGPVDGPIAAPIAKGTKLGTAVVTLPDNRAVEYPLEAGADVPRMGVFGRVTTMIQHYLFGWLS